MRGSDAVVPSMPFSAVAGHTDRIYFGCPSPDGRNTLEKKTTAWEVMYYLGMHFQSDIVGWVSSQARGVVVDVVVDVDVMLRFVTALQGMRAFVSELSFLRFPVDWIAAGATPIVGGSHLGNCIDHDSGLCMVNEKPGSFWASIFINLFAGSSAVEGASGYDEQKWGLGLIDITSGFSAPSVMDVKVGFIRYNRISPQAKKDKINRKDEGTLLRKVALRISGLRRHVHTVNNSGHCVRDDSVSCGSRVASVEELGKSFGLAMKSESEMVASLHGFFSVEGRLTTTTTTTEVGSSTVAVALRSDVIETVSERSRRAHALAAVQGMLHCFRDTNDGQYLLAHVAFVSCSVLIAYDAVDTTDRLTYVRLIDFAMCSPRKLNYDEGTVGFIEGLENLKRYLSLGGPN